MDFESKPTKWLEREMRRVEDIDRDEIQAILDERGRRIKETQT